MAASFVLGGVGATLTMDNVVDIATGERRGEWEEEKGATSRQHTHAAPPSRHDAPLPPTPCLSGATVALDAAALDRVKKVSPTPTAFKGEDEATAAAADSAAAATGGTPTLTEPQARAVVLARVLSLVNGSTRVR